MTRPDQARWRFPSTWKMDIIRGNDWNLGVMVTFSLVHHTANGTSAAESLPMILDPASIERLVDGLSSALVKIRQQAKP